MAAQTVRSGFRVMMFRLNAQHRWDDYGTGFVEDPVHGTLRVICEESNTVLLFHRIQSDHDYAKQGDAIITWFDTESTVDLALSFEHSDNCDRIWEQIQSAIAFSDENIQIEALDAMDTVDDFEEVSIPTLDNLSKVSNEILSSFRNSRKVSVNEAYGKAFMDALRDVFSQAYDLEAYDSLFLIFTIVRQLFFLGSASIIDMLTGPDLLQTTVHMLEYDPELTEGHDDPSEVDFNRHRKALKAAQFREVIPLRNDALLQTIKTHYYVTYIRDVIMLKYLNDGLTQTLNSMLFASVSNIVTPLMENDHFLDLLFAKIGSVPNETRLVSQDSLDTYRFVAELVSLIKNLALHSYFFGRFCARGLLGRIASLLFDWQSNVSPSGNIIHRMVPVLFEIVHTIAVHDPQYVKAAMLSEGPKSVLMAALIGTITTKTDVLDDSMQSNATELLMILLLHDSNKFLHQETFIESCFEVYLNNLVSCITNPSTRGNSVINAATLLTFCIRSHASTLAFALRRCQWHSAAMCLLMNRDHMQLMLLGLRMVRAALSHLLMPSYANDEMQDGKTLLNACVDLFLFNGVQRYNLLNSTFIELVEFVRASNIKPLVNYFARVQLQRIGPVSYVSVFDAIALKAEQNQEDPVVDTISTTVRVQESQTFSELQREEEYFESPAIDPDPDTMTDHDVTQTWDMDSAVGSTKDASLPTFIERKHFQPRQDPGDFLLAVKKRKKLTKGVAKGPVKTLSISPQRLVQYSIGEDDDSDGDADRRKSVRDSLAHASLATPPVSNSADVTTTLQYTALRQGT